MTSDHDDDVRVLLERAAALAPDRLDRPAVPGQARRRAARSALGGGLAAVLMGGAALLAVPLLGGGGEQRLAQQPASGQAPNGPQTEAGTGTQTYVVRYVDASAYDEDTAGRALDRCLALPGAEHTGRFATLPPQPVVVATGTAGQRQAVQDCLSALPNTDIELVRADIGETHVAVSVDVVGLDPLRVEVTVPRPDPDGAAWLMHDLALTNPTGQPVHVNDLRFAQALTGVPAQGRSAEAPARLFVALGCVYSQPAPDEPMESFCHDDYAGTTIGPGATETFQIKLWRDPSATAGPEPASSGYTAAFPVSVRTTGPFTPGDDDGPQGTVRLTYRPGVAGLLGPESKGSGPSRASFLPLPEEEPGVERGFLLARAEGILGGDPTTGCLWLSALDGSRGAPIVLLHDTAVADFDRTPWVIRDGDRVLAAEGDRVVLGGGYGPDDEPGAVPGCPVTGTPFIGQLDPAPAD